MLLPAGDAGNNSYALRVDFGGSGKAGDFKCAISIPFTDPTNALPIAIGVSGKVGAEMVAIPGVLLLPVSEEPVSRIIFLRLLGSGNRDLAVDSISLEKTEGAVFTAQVIPDNPDVRITLTFSPEFTRQLHAEKEKILHFTSGRSFSAGIICRTRDGH